MKKTLYTLSITLFSTSLYAQTPTLGWAGSIGGVSSSSGKAIAVDASGSVYTAGSFTDTIDADPGPGIFKLGTVGGYDIYISKLDAAGNFVWAKSIGSSGYQSGEGIALDQHGHLYITGSTTGTTDFDPGPGTTNLITSGAYDPFLLKMDTAGNFIWARRWGSNSGSFYDYATSVAVDAEGNVYTTGNFAGTADFDPGPGTSNLTSAGDANIFVSKIDTAGNLLWARGFGGNSTLVGDEGSSISVDGAGNVYTTGHFFGTGDFDPGPGTLTFSAGAAGDQGVFLSKLDSAGNLVWAKQITGGEVSAGNIVADHAGNVYATGKYRSGVDFDPGTGIVNLPYAGGYYDIFVLKLDTAGDFAWAKQLGGPNNLQGDDGNAITLDNAGNVYIAGSFLETADFDPSATVHNVTSNGFIDMYVCQLSPAGDFISVVTMGGADIDALEAITVDASGNIFATGYFSNTVDFDPRAGVHNLVSVGHEDAVVLKLEPWVNGIPTTHAAIPFAIFPNPSDGMFHVVLADGSVNSSISVYNHLGALVSRQSGQGGKYLINLSHMPAGVYYVRATTDNGTATTQKIIKQ